MYQNIWITNRTEDEPSVVYVFDDEQGILVANFSDFDYAYVKSTTGRYVSLFGDQLKKVTKRWDFKDQELFESDLPRETRVLTDLYLDSDDPSKNHRTFIFDIEVDSKGGFATIEKADKAITAISSYIKQSDQYKCFIFDPEKLVTSRIEGNKEILSFETEFELLTKWLEYYKSVNPTIISGYNSNKFDIPYLYNRLRNVFDFETANSLSPINLVRYSQRRGMFQIAGVSCLDYIELYKKFTYTQQPSYRLDAIGQFEIGKGKVQFEGNLDQLYRTDINKFVQYNLDDTEIVVLLDNKMKLIELVRGICHIGHVPYEDFAMSSRFIEGAIICYLHRHAIIAPNKKELSDEQLVAMEDDDDQFEGAYVKEPIPGLYEWVYNLDLQSLYPSIMMSLNISPETKFAKIINFDLEQHRNNKMSEYHINLGKQLIKVSANEFPSFLEQHNLTLSSNGVMYRKDQKGVLPIVIDKWFANRLMFKEKMKEELSKGNLEMADFYDRRQHIEKIFLNSIYGSVGLRTFRFHDIDNAEAVTLTGQEIIKTTSKFIELEYANKKELLK